MYVEMKEKNLRFFSFISTYIMQNKIYPCSEAFGMAHNYESLDHQPSDLDDLIAQLCRLLKLQLLCGSSHLRFQIFDQAHGLIFGNSSQRCSSDLSISSCSLSIAYRFEALRKCLNLFLDTT